jgi:hypothetical protein
MCLHDFQSQKEDAVTEPVIGRDFFILLLSI